MSRRWRRVIGIAISVLGLGAGLPWPAFAVEMLLLADTYTSSATAGSPLGADAALRVHGPGVEDRVFLLFNLTPLPANTTGSHVAKASLRLWVDHVETPGTVIAREVLAPWGEQTVTHATAPALGDPVGTVNVVTGGRFVAIDVTDVVRSWVDGTLVNRGVALVAGPGGVGVEFDSKENVGTSHEPRLDVVLSGVAGVTGDITGVAAGIGLTGGGTTGAVSLGIAPRYRLPQSCNAHQVAKANADGTWRCANDLDRLPACAPHQVPKANGDGTWRCAGDLGTISGVTTTAGSGLTGGRTGGIVDLSLHTAYRLPQSCLDGELPKWDTGAAEWICQPDRNSGGDITAVSAGLGLSGGGTSGHVTLNLAFAGSGSATTPARSDHTHTTGADDTAVGGTALAALTTGRRNTAVGAGALAATTTGDDNTAIGVNAGRNQTTGGNNIYVGHPGVATESNTIHIGDTHRRTFVAGIRGVTTGVPDALAVVVDGAGQLGTVSSSRRVKFDVQDMGAVSERLLRLRPVTFRYSQPSADGSTPVQYGLIAEEVAQVFPELVANGGDGQPASVFYHVMPGLLLNELQRQHRRVEELTRRLAAQHAQLEALHRVVQALTETLSSRIEAGVPLE